MGKSRRLGIMLLGIVLPALSAAESTARSDRKSTKLEPLSITKGVLCRDVRGYRDYDPLPVPELTRDDKLLIYCEPTGHAIEPDKDKGFRAHFVTEGKLRRKGRKELLFSQKKLLDYAPAAPYPPKRIYLRTHLEIKGLGPGEYEFELIVHDVLGDDRTASQIIPFTVVTAKAAPADEPEKPAAKKKAR